MNIIKNLTGQKFGRLEVIELADQDWNGCALWLCRCDCGKETIVLSNHLRRGNTKSCGCLHQESASKLCKERNVKGKNNPGYIDGRTKVKLELKEKIRKRDNYICQKCSKTQEQNIKETGKILDVHHIDENDINDVEENMITLCRSCHNNTRELK